MRYTVIADYKKQMTKKRRQIMYLHCNLKPNNRLHMPCITWLFLPTISSSTPHLKQAMYLHGRQEA